MDFSETPLSTSVQPSFVVGTGGILPPLQNKWFQLGIFVNSIDLQIYAVKGEPQIHVHKDLTVSWGHLLLMI